MCSHSAHKKKNSNDGDFSRIILLNDKKRIAHKAIPIVT